MKDKLEGLPREFQRIQKNWRVSVPKRFRETMKWRIGDQVCLHFENGRITVENLEAQWRKKHE